MKIAIVAITRHGVTLAGRLVAALPGAHLFVPEKFQAEAERIAPGAVCSYVGPVGAQIPALFAAFEGLIAIVSVGAVVRLIAPHLRDKTSDPAVVVVDEAGKFAIPVLSGHLGGANALAVRLATALGAIPVLTTASDVRQTLAVDLLGRELGWTVDVPHETLVRASAAVVNDEPVALVQEAGRADWWPNHAGGRSGSLPPNLVLFDRLEAIEPERFTAVLWISTRELPAALTEPLRGKLVIYRPGLC
jgi:cobalt-precorrin 5A hydrolase